MCFELYYLANSGAFTENDSTSFDTNIIAAALLLFQNVYFFFRVSLDAAFVGEEAVKGFDIIRRHGVQPDDSMARKYLVLNANIWTCYIIK